MLLGIEREILEFHRTAIQTHEIAGLSEYRSELVHDAAFHAAVVVLGALTDSRKLELVDSEAEKLVKSECECAFKGSRRGHSCSKRNITGENCVEAAYIAASFLDLTAHTENVACPALCRHVFFCKSEFAVLIKIESECTYCICAVCLDLSHHPFIDCSGEDESSVVVGMLADEVDTSCRGKEFTFCLEKGLEFFSYSGFHIFSII